MSLENPKTSGVVTLNYIVMSILNRIKDYSMRDYLHYMQLAIEGFTELSLWHLSNIEVVYLRMNLAKVVSLPADYVDYLKIGIPINGKLRVLTKHDNILLPRTFEDGESVGNTDSDNTTDPNSVVFFSDHFRNGSFVGGLFGLPGGIDDAYYRIDKERRTITFSGIVDRSEIVLEYVSSGINVAGSTVIPREAAESLRTWIIWQTKENNPRLSLSDKMRAEQNHDKAIAAFDFFQGAFTIDEYKRMIWGTTFQSIKR
jgi:hypothetical protein